MKRPWQIWLWFAVCVACVLPAMCWLTWTTLALDRAREEDRQQTELARRYAEVQERTNSALWRMDWMMIPLVAQEAARPYFMYRPFYAATPRVNQPLPESDTNLATRRPSPILLQPSEYVRLHFEISPGGAYSSPQDPQGVERDLAVFQCSVPAETIEKNGELLSQVQIGCSYESMCIACPSQSLPSVDGAANSWQQNEQVASQVAANNISPSLRLLDNSAAEIPEFQESPQEATGNERESISTQQLKRNYYRGNQELLQRGKAAQSYAFGQLSQNSATAPSESLAREGVMKPIWVGDKLLLVRRVTIGQQIWIQGCWLDWDKIKQSLSREISELLPSFELEPIREDETLDNSVPRMATLPVKLIVDMQRLIAEFGLASATPPPIQPISGLRLSIWVAWACLGIGVVAIAVLLHGVVQISERRGVFVSAVTHELRTPLTTFRMYAEMLAEGMVATEERKRQYASTMKVEADRLGHLVENVLQYSRLEKNTSSQQRWSSTTIAEMIQRCQFRLAEHAAQQGLELRVHLLDEVGDCRVTTDQSAVEQILFNLVENACKYARPSQEPWIDLKGQMGQSEVHLTVRDFGPGICADVRRRLFRAFCKSDQEAADTAQGVGLGLALCQRIARHLGGSLILDTQHEGPGAAFRLSLKRDPSTLP